MLKTILLVEDDEILRISLSRLIAAAGYGVVAAQDTMAALTQLDQCAPDLLITDAKMPPGIPHGFALARMARAKNSRLPIIVITGYPDDFQSESALNVSMLRKPVPPDVLLHEIAQRIGPAPKAPAKGPPPVVTPSA